jgi:gluconolactonase
VIKLDPDGSILQMIAYCNGTAFRGPNQLIFGSEGGLYFTASGDFEEDWRTGRPAGAIYYFRPGEEVVQLDDGLCFANGITLSPDGRKLIVNEHRKNRILQYDVEADGTISNRRVFAKLDGECLLPDDESYELGPDGNCCDSQGNIWAAHYGGGKIVGFNSEGQRIATIRLPQGRRPTNVAVMPDSRVLYVTESEDGLLYRIRFED